MALLQPKVPFGVFPCACWNPYFCSVWWLWMGTKKDHFPKTDSCNENARFFYLPNTNSVCLFFKKCHFCKKHLLCSQPPQKHYFSVFFFLKFSFSMFFIFSLFSFSNIKKTKTKSAHFFSKTLFWHPDKLPKIIFAPYTLFVFFRQPKNTIKLGENKQNKILDQVLTQPWTKFDSKKPKSWTKFWIYSRKNPVKPSIFNILRGFGDRAQVNEWTALPSF